LIESKFGIPTGELMKSRSSIITVCIGVIILSVFMLVKEPAYGTANLGVFCTFMKNASPVLMFVSCIFIMLASTKLRVLSIIGVVLIVGSLVATYIFGELSGYSMGTSGWVSGFVGILVIVPAGLFLCCMTGLFSLVDMLEKESAVKKPVVVSALVILLLGITYHVVADWKPDIRSLVEAIKNDENEYERFSLAGRLWEIQDDKLPPLLIVLLEDKNPRVREASALALGGKSRNAMAVQPLLRALDRETDEKAKEWIIRAFGTVVPLAEPADRSEALETLIQVLKNGKGDIKAVAAQALGMIKDERAIQPLIDALSDKDADFFAHDALITITGNRFERDPDEWNKWMAGRNISHRAFENAQGIKVQTNHLKTN